MDLVLPDCFDSGLSLACDFAKPPYIFPGESSVLNSRIAVSMASRIDR